MHTPLGSGSVPDLMVAFRRGNRGTVDKLVELLYPELRRLAASEMKGEHSEHPWQPTLLVNELYFSPVRIRALGGSAADPEQEKTDFLAAAGNIMKRLLISHSRPLYRRAEKIEMKQTHAGSSDSEALQSVELALSRLRR